jgi:hypothetical protein
MKLAIYRLRSRRSIRSPMGGSRAGLLAATVAAILAHSSTWSSAVAQQAGSVARQRDEAPIGHRQPRIQDLPRSTVREENEMLRGLHAYDKKLENSICRKC